MNSAHLARELSELACIINTSDSQITYPSITNGTTVFYAAVQVNGGNITAYKNAVTASVAVVGVPVLIADDFTGCEVFTDGVPVGSIDNTLLRHFMAGSGTANQAQIRARLDAFYTARGL